MPDSFENLFCLYQRLFSMQNPMRSIMKVNMKHRPIQYCCGLGWVQQYWFLINIVEHSQLDAYYNSRSSNVHPVFSMNKLDMNKTSHFWSRIRWGKILGLGPIQKQILVPVLVKNILVTVPVQRKYFGPGFVNYF